MIRPNLRLIDSLINSTKNNHMQWINMEFLKEYLKRDDISLNVIPKLRDYLLYLQQERFIFDCSSTYLGVNENRFFVLSRSKYSSLYRIDMLELDSECASWREVLTPISSILRLRNVIDVINQDNDSECADLLATISLNSHA